MDQVRYILSTAEAILLHQRFSDSDLDPGSQREKIFYDYAEMGMEERLCVYELRIMKPANQAISQLRIEPQYLPLKGMLVLRTRYHTNSDASYAQVLAPVASNEHWAICRLQGWIEDSAWQTIFNHLPELFEIHHWDAITYDLDTRRAIQQTCDLEEDIGDVLKDYGLLDNQSGPKSESVEQRKNGVPPEIWMNWTATFHSAVITCNIAYFDQEAPLSSSLCLPDSFLFTVQQC